MYSAEQTVATSNKTISLSFFPPFNKLHGEFSPVKLDLAVPHNFTFSCPSLKKDMEKVRWESFKKSLNTKILCLSNFNSACSDVKLIAFDDQDDLKLPLQLVKLSCEYNVDYDLEITDSGVSFHLVQIEPNIDSVKIDVNLAIRSNAGKLKSIQQATFSCANAEISEVDKGKLYDRFMTSLYRDCLEKELFSAVNEILRENAIFHISHKETLLHEVTQHNINLIKNYLLPDGETGGAVWVGRSLYLLNIAYEMAKYMQATNRIPTMNIHEFAVFLGLDNLHHTMIAYGGNSDICEKPVSDLREFLLSIPGFDNNFGCKYLGQSKKAYEHHGYLLMQINRAINDISLNSRWVD